MADESRFTEETLARWLEPLHAVRALIDAGLDDREQAVSWLKGRLRGGELDAGGWHLALDPDDPLRVKSLMLPGRYKVSTWRDIGAIPWKDDFWVSGDFTPDDPLDHGWRTLERCEFEHYLTGVRFDPEPIVDFCKRSQSPLADLAPQTEPAKRSPGGRPPKPFWDQLWASIGASLYNGDLQPKRQADIENAMHDWLTFHGENAGETTVRAKAKQIWDAIQKEV